MSLLSFSKMYISAVSWLSVIEFHKKHIEVGGKAAYDFSVDWIGTLVALAV